MKWFQLQRKERKGKQKREREREGGREKRREEDRKGGRAIHHLPLFSFSGTSLCPHLFVLPNQLQLNQLKTKKSKCLYCFVVPFFQKRIDIFILIHPTLEQYGYLSSAQAICSLLSMMLTFNIHIKIELTNFRFTQYIVIFQ